MNCVTVSRNQDRICSSCSQPFRTKWRYARCQRCRYQESYKDQCACGARKDARSPRCRECSLGCVQLPDPLSAARVAWVAGLLEAEGTFPLRRTGGGTIRVEMADQDVIGRLYEILGVGNLGTYVPKNPHHKQTWMLTIARREYVNWLLLHITPLMSARRSAAITRLAANYKEAIQLPPPVSGFTSLPDLAAAA